MRNVNKVILLGNIANAPELRTTNNGETIATFVVATNNSSSKDKPADFHRCTAWSRLGEICKQILHKGDLVYLEGYLKTRSWEAEDGTRVFKTEVIVTDMIKLSKRRGDNEEDDYQSGQRYSMDYDNETNNEDSDSEDTGTGSEENSSGNNEETPENEEENLIDKDLGL